MQDINQKGSEEKAYSKDFFNLLKSRRSIRKFKSREIEKEKLDILLKSALLAPSSMARRPWEFIAVTDREKLIKLSKCREHGSGFLEGAPLGVVIAADPDACDVWIEDTSIAAAFLQLSAQSLGFGSCWIQVRKRNHSEGKEAEDYIKEVLGIPERLSVECIIAVGYPAEEKLAYNEKNLMYGKLHFDKY